MTSPWGAFAEKSYPDEYDPLAVRILEKMAFPLGKLQLFGSMTIPSQLYAGDYDAVCYVSFKTLEEATREFQLRVKEIAELSDCFLGDMKIGEKPEWNLWEKTSLRLVGGKYEVSGYSKKSVLKRLGKLWESGVITDTEHSSILGKIDTWGDSPPAEEYVAMVKEFRPNVIRWTLQEVMAGGKMFPNKETITLSQALTSRGVVKVDAVGIVGGQSRFTDFSCIYEIKVKSSVITDRIVGADIEEALRQSLYENVLQGNYYKALKRLYSLLRFYKHGDVLKELSEFLNGAVGIVYQVYGDVKTLIFLEENYTSLPREKIAYELKMFRVRLTSFQKTFKNQTLNQIIKDLLSSREKPQTLRFYKEMEDKLAEIMNRVAKEEMVKIYPKAVPGEKATSTQDPDEEKNEDK